MVKVTRAEGDHTRTAPVGKPVPALAGVAVEPAVGTAVQPPSATIMAGTGSVRVAWAVVNWLVLLTTIV